MGEDIGLFGAKHNSKSLTMNKARIFTAWATFSLQAQFNYYYFRPPHLQQPPQVPLPDPKVDPQWYGEIWIQYPRSQTPIPLHLGQKIQAEAILHVIMNEIGSLLFRRPLLRPPTPDEIIALKVKLDDWKDNLPETLQPKRLVFPQHFALQ